MIFITQFGKIPRTVLDRLRALLRHARHCAQGQTRPIGPRSVGFVVLPRNLSFGERERLSKLGR
jgi:hypothetical protein